MMTLSNNLSRLFVMTASLLFATIAMAAQPKWITDSTLEYPSAMYLVGRGIGSTADEAQNRARGDLATIFEVRIEVINSDEINVARSGSKEQVDRKSSQQVSAKTDKVISGINIAEVWRDPVTQDVHAIAVLPRAQASASLREELAKIDDGMTQHMKTAQAENDLLLKVGALSQALQATINREGFQASLKIVDPSGRGVPSPFTQASVQKQISDTLKKVSIASEITEDAGYKDFALVMKRGLAAAGFLAANAANADLVLESKLSLTDIGKADGMYWTRGTVEVSLVERASGRVRGGKTWPVKEAARDARTSRTRTLIEIEKLLKEELRSAIVEFASS